VADGDTSEKEPSSAAEQEKKGRSLGDRRKRSQMRMWSPGEPEKGIFPRPEAAPEASKETFRRKGVAEGLFQALHGEKSGSQGGAQNNRHSCGSSVKELFPEGLSLLGRDCGESGPHISRRPHDTPASSGNESDQSTEPLYKPCTGRKIFALGINPPQAFHTVSRDPREKTHLQESTQKEGSRKKKEPASRKNSYPGLPEADKAHEKGYHTSHENAQKSQMKDFHHSPKENTLFREKGISPILRGEKSLRHRQRLHVFPALSREPFTIPKKFERLLLLQEV